MKHEPSMSVPEELAAKQPRYPDGKEQIPLLSQPLLHELLRIPFSSQVAARVPSSFAVQVTARGSTASEVHVSGGVATVVAKSESALTNWPRALLSAIAASLNQEVTSLTEEDLQQVDRLNLRAVRIVDDSLKHLGKLTNLRKLWLGGMQLTEAGLAHLSKLTNLQDLRLEHTQVTDAGLVHLGTLTNLEQLWLIETQVSDAGKELLKDMLPNCRIVM